MTLGSPVSTPSQSCDFVQTFTWSTPSVLPEGVLRVTLDEVVWPEWGRQRTNQGRGGMALHGPVSACFHPIPVLRLRSNFRRVALWKFRLSFRLRANFRWVALWEFRLHSNFGRVALWEFRLSFRLRANFRWVALWEFRLRSNFGRVALWEFRGLTLHKSGRSRMTGMG
jgi:hypothetical protein